MTVGSEIQDDFATILSEAGNAITLIRTTNTLGSDGDVLSTSTVSYSITAFLQNIQHSDRDIHEMGLAEPGNVKCFFKNESTPPERIQLKSFFFCNLIEFRSRPVFTGASLAARPCIINIASVSVF